MHLRASFEKKIPGGAFRTPLAFSGLTALGSGRSAARVLRISEIISHSFQINEIFISLIPRASVIPEDLPHENLQHIPTTEATSK